MSNNFVDIVGYQLERVHTGVIAWMLDWSNPNVTPQQKYGILSRIYAAAGEPIPFGLPNIRSIVCRPEYAFGRRRKIDLVVQIGLNDDTFKHLVMEMKVDSIPYEDQLLGTREDFQSDPAHTPGSALFLLLLFGSSQVCAHLDPHSFTLLRVPDILDIFAAPSLNHHVYSDWIEALQNEMQRASHLQSRIRLAPSMSLDEHDEQYWKRQGYRLWFPLFYYMYDELKSYSTRQNEWIIEGGGNNPVMNWRDGWLTKTVYGYPVQFYWEFNYQEFVLKVKLEETNRMPQSELIRLKATIAQMCVGRSLDAGRPTQNRSGIYSSLYKWSFNFKTHGLRKIMDEVDVILDTIQPALASQAFP